MEVLRQEPKTVPEGSKCLTANAKVVKPTGEVELVPGYLVVPWPDSVNGWLKAQGEERTLADIQRARAIAVQANIRLALGGGPKRPKSTKKAVAEKLLAKALSDPKVARALGIADDADFKALLAKQEQR